MPYNIPTSVKIAQMASCEVMGVTLQMAKSKTKIREAVAARQICMTVLLETTNMSSSVVGSFFNKDHATVLHAKRTVSNLYETDKEYAAKVDRVRKSVDLGIFKPSVTIFKTNAIHRALIAKRRANPAIRRVA